MTGIISGYYIEPTLDIFGLASAIRSHTEGARPSFAVDLDLMEDRKQLPEEVAINLFRVYQEALANVEKHAGANRVEVRFTLSPSEVVLSVRDDGCGFVVPRRLGEFARDGRFGLLGMQERMRMIGGRLRVISQPGQGTEISVRVPLQVGHGSDQGEADQLEGDQEQAGLQHPQHRQQHHRNPQGPHESPQEIGGVEDARRLGDPLPPL